MKFTSALFFLCAAMQSAYAFQVEETPKEEKYEVVNGITVISIGGVAFSLYEIPNSASQYEITSSTENHSELKSKLILGEPVSKSEAIRVIEAYYRETAIDFPSIIIKDVKISDPVYAVWCSNPWLMGCLEWQGAAGSHVEYQINGKNRSGGMTGFSEKHKLIRKFSGSKAIAPQAK